MINKQKVGSALFYLMSIAMTWVLIGQIYQRNITTDKLIRVKGIVDSSQEVITRVKKRLLNTRIDKELRIQLKGKPEHFRIMEVYNYSEFAHQINSGDTAELFIRPKWLIPLGLGKRNDVFHIIINGATIFNVEQTRRNANGIIVVALISIPAFLLLAQWVKRRC